MSVVASVSREAVVDVVERRLGIRCGGARGDLIRDRITEAMHLAGHDDPVAYARLLETDDDARGALAEALRVPETYFLREPAQLHVVETQLLPQLATATSGRALRLWSAGCSNGEEAYSLAIIAERAGVADRSQVLATDRSELGVQAVTAGTYPSRSLRTMDPPERGRWFTRASDGRWQVADRLRRRVVARTHDLVADPYPVGMDLIVCRNVLLYFTPAHARRVIAQLTAALNPGGWLVLGSSDPDAAGERRLVRSHGDVPTLYQRLDAAPPPPRARRAPTTRRPNPPVRPPAPSVAETSDARRDPDPAPPPEDLQDPDHTIEWCETQLRRRPLDPLLHARLATARLDAADPAGASEAATAALFLDAELVVGHLVLGQACLLLADPAGAARAFDNAARVLAALPVTAGVPGSPLPVARLRQVAAAGRRRAAVWSSQ